LIAYRKREVAVLRPDEVERLSQLMSGELSAAEAAELQVQIDRRPELGEAWDRLASLELLTGSLAAPPASALIERAVARTLRPVARWPRARWGIAASLVALAAAALLLWPAPAGVGPQTAGLLTQVAAYRVTEGSEVRAEGEKIYRLVKGTALFEGDLSVRVGEETLKVKGRALVTTEPSVALAHVTDLVTPTNEELEMIRQAKKTWLTAVLAVMVFTGEVQADEKIASGKSYAKQPKVEGARDPSWTPGLAVVNVVPSPGKTPPVAKELFDFDGVNDAVLAQGQPLSRCFEAGLKQNPKLAGKLTALLTISSAGALEEATIGGDYSLNNPFVASCVLDALGKVKFPAPKGVERAQLAYPLEFAIRGENGSQLMLPRTADCPSCTFINSRAEKVAVEVGSSPFSGPADAKVTVIIFSEAECSFCVKAHAVLKQLQTEYAGKVRFVFKHRPLPSNPGARQAALALHAAASQGKFWELLDRAYNAPVSTESGLYDAQARSIGLDLQKYRRDVESPATAAVIDADTALAEKLGVKGVPSWFINGQELVGFRPIEVMRKAIDAQLAAPGPTVTPAGH
jgi:protein-disulfide isomerase